MSLAPIFDRAAMAGRRQAWYRFVRQQAAAMFQPDGRYAPTTKADLRLAYWVYPALVSGESPADRELANRVYAAAASWDAFDIFGTSSIAVNLARHAEQMTAALRQRSAEHLSRFLVADNGRAPCAGANDYVFHGYNDNMPAMATRALILGGEALGRPEYIDRGLFNLEGLAAHFQRRGLLSEYNSATYTPITLTALMDVVECAQTAAARELAAGCAQRVMLDLLAHWHPELGLPGGAMSRASTPEMTGSFTNANALYWYWSGHPLCLDPIAVLGGNDYDGPMAHARNRAWNLAGITELFGPDYDRLPAGLLAWVQSGRSYPYELQATTDAGQQGLLGGVKEIRVRAFHQPTYFLGTASETWFGQAGQQLTLHGGLAATATLSDWHDRVTFWHRTIAGAPDQGDREAALTGRAHAITNPVGVETAEPSPTEVSHVPDVGVYHILQHRGSAMVLGMIGPASLDQLIPSLKLSILFHTRWRSADELVEVAGWVFLRFGKVYVGVRASGMVEQQRRRPGVVSKNHYLRIELPLVTEPARRVTQEFREWCDYGYVLEIADETECGSFAAFQGECRAARWEFLHGFYRTSRYQGRHGDLHIVDSVAAGSVRFMTINGEVEVATKLAATGLNDELTQLLPSGQTMRPRRLVYWPAHIGSPFYKWPGHIIQSDQGAAGGRASEGTSRIS